jgi:hypothetical protein
MAGASTSATAVLGALGFEELEPRRHAREEIAHLDAGSGVAGGGLELLFLAAVDADGECLVRPVCARQEGEPGNRADGGKRLAAKAQRADRKEVLLGELGGSVPLDREDQVLRRHP